MSTSAADIGSMSRFFLVLRTGSTVLQPRHGGSNDASELQILRSMDRFYIGYFNNSHYAVRSWTRILSLMFDKTQTEVGTQLERTKAQVW